MQGGLRQPPLSAKSTPMQWFFSALYHDINKSNLFLLAFLDRFHHCAQLPTNDTEILVVISIFDFTVILTLQEFIMGYTSLRESNVL